MEEMVEMELNDVEPNGNIKDNPPNMDTLDVPNKPDSDISDDDEGG